MSCIRWIGGAVAGLALALIASCPTRAQDTPVGRGEYLFRAADCAACHGNPVSHDLTGGRAFDLPFGTVYAGNITPDGQTGIGAYSDAQWLRMMRQGIARDGTHLYPVMPYTAYTRLSDADALAIKSYLSGLRPVRQMAPSASLRFPFNQRWTLVFWNWLYNPNRRMATVPGRSPAWNRGAYLAEALGHCAQCHTPRTVFYGLSGRAYAGAIQVGWRAYNLTADPTHGIGGWSDAALGQYLATGAAPGHGPASGPMAEAVSDSLRYLSGSDIAALVTYLRTIPARPDGPPTAPVTPQSALGLDQTRGGRLFADACAGCHLPDGTGRQSPWAALAGAHSMSDPQATNINAILQSGSAIDTTEGRMFMHRFDRAYRPQERAALTSYLRRHFGEPFPSQ